MDMDGLANMYQLPNGIGIHYWYLEDKRSGVGCGYLKLLLMENYTKDFL